jgi:hypothetical protein
LVLRQEPDTGIQLFKIPKLNRKEAAKIIGGGLDEDHITSPIPPVSF